jgi:hypothetical protein
VLAGYLEVVDGRTERGLARMRRMLDETRDTQHAPGYRAVLARLLAEACAVAGDLRGGVAAAEALLERWARLWEAEAHRLRAEFRAALGEDVRAELELALDVARRQGARSLELRAATSLLRHSGTDDARQRLVAVLAGMPEDADTPDRRDAEALLW